MRRKRSGLTLLELAVVVGIIGLLLAILIPAVQQARAAARRTQCVNNLKQIGLSCHNFVSSHRVFPSSGSNPYRRIEAGLASQNREQFRCPADSWSDDTNVARSYLLNSGTNFRGNDQGCNGFHLMFRDRMPSEFTDGQSQTAAFSERLAAPLLPDPATARGSPERFLWWTARVVPNERGNEGAFIEVCRNERVAVTPVWQFTPDSIGAGYDHFLTPNLFGCWNGPFDESDRHQVIVPASSLHSGGVNVLFVDGHVSFAADGVDWQVWQALGTVAEGDSAGSAFE